MRELRGNLAIAGVVLGLFCAAAPAGQPPVTAAVDVTITVLPYAQVTLDETTLDVTITFAETETVWGPVYIGGTIVCNCPVMVFARVNPPAEAPGVWQADTMVARVEVPGLFQYGNLLRVVVWDIPAGSGSMNFTLGVTGRSAATISEVLPPNLGEVVVTVVPE